MTRDAPEPNRRRRARRRGTPAAGDDRERSLRLYRWMALARAAEKRQRELVSGGEAHFMMP